MKNLFVILIILFILTNSFLIKAEGDSELEVYKISSSESIRVLSFNIRYNNPEDGINKWDNRKNMVNSILPFNKVDIAGIQEAEKNQIEDMDTALPDYEWVGEGRDGKNEGEFNPIFYRKDKFEIMDWDTFWLSENPDSVGSKGWDASLPRIVTWAKFKIVDNGKVFYHFNTHFDHKGEKARKKSSHLILKKVEEITNETPMVITGDFNDKEDSEVYDIITEKYQDAFYKTKNKHHGPKTTLHLFKGLTRYEWNDNDRIDFIFAGDEIEILQHGVLTDRKAEGLPSDHFPVLAEITFEGL